MLLCYYNLFFLSSCLPSLSTTFSAAAISPNANEVFNHLYGGGKEGSLPVAGDIVSAERRQKALTLHFSGVSKLCIFPFYFNQIQPLTELDQNVQLPLSLERNGLTNETT